MQLARVFSAFAISALIACGSQSSGPSAAQAGSAGKSSGASGSTNSNGGTAPVGGATTAAGGLVEPTTAGAAGSVTSETAGAGGASMGGTGGKASVGGAAGVSAVAGGTGDGGVDLSKEAETKLPGAGVTIVSYGGYLNGESFQQDGIVTHEGYQYVAFWNAARHVVLARRQLPSGTWSALEFSDYTNTEGDAHNTISIGICPGDGTLHLAFDHHGSTLHYRKSAAGLLASGGSVAWATASFSAVADHLLGSSAQTMVTYPRFITEPGGKKMLFEARIGESGSGDELLWEYDSDSQAWASIGEFINGTGNSINAYPHGLSYARGGTRLHVSWCWRETSNAATNHDLLYAYSDDHGRTWKNNAGTNIAKSGSMSITRDSAGIKVWTIAQNRGLINQEHMAVDATGRVHVLLSHLPDAQADDSNFDNARTKSQYFHYFRDAAGMWSRTAMTYPAQAAFRGKLAIAASGNLYAVLPDMRIAAASAAQGFKSWSLLASSDAGKYFSDPLIDTARLANEDELSIFYPRKNSSDIYVLDYRIH
ncbi:MAG TPA: BNR repeat-containing protein [Polyangiaceae bacterium]|nr:BNR repeat-containing protein [Polyangiaceae bacterium]